MRASPTGSCSNAIREKMRFPSKLSRHHHFQRFRGKVEAVRVPWNPGEIVVLVKRLRRVVDTVQEDGHECKRLARLVAVAEGLCEKALAESLAFPVLTHS